MTETIPYVIIRAEPLKAVVRAIVTSAGSSAREADLVAEHLVEANLTGHDSHGVGMLPRYIEVFLAGDLKINEHVTVVSDTGALLTLNGNAGFGQVMGFEAMERGIERAAQHGVAVVGLANSHHIGRIGHWAEQCIRAASCRCTTSTSSASRSWHRSEGVTPVSSPTPSASGSRCQVRSLSCSTSRPAASPWARCGWR